MFYVIQDNKFFKEEHYNLLIDILKKFDIGHEIIGFKPFVKKLEFKTTRKDVWVWGSVSMSEIAYKYGWRPGSMYNVNHDIDMYGPKYGTNMLNYDGITMNLTDELPERFKYFFARPTKDTKAFSGQLFERETWNQWVKDVIKERKKSKQKVLTPKTRVQIAPLKTIEQEIRCWVVKGKVVTTSRYKLGSKVTYQNYDHETYITEFAQSMVDIYQPAEAFVMDVCLHDNMLKIVELNCVNSAGFYYADMFKLIEAIETNF